MNDKPVWAPLAHEMECCAKCVELRQRGPVGRMPENEHQAQALVHVIFHDSKVHEMEMRGELT